MDLSVFLKLNRKEITALAAESFSRAPLEFTNEEGVVADRDRITILFDLTVQCLATKNYLPLIRFSENLARERYEQYYDLHDVHIAFNVLEEEIWKKITDDFDPKEFRSALALITTVIGFAKEMLASKYSSLSSDKVYIKACDYGMLSVAY